MVIDVLVDMALDYVSEKAFKMSMDSAVHYALNFKDRRELKERLDSEMAKSVEEIPVSECTRRIIGSDGRYGTAFKKGIVNSVLMLDDQPDAASEMGVAGALLRGRRKEKDWFVTRPPIPKENLDTVRKDVDSIVEHMQDAMWDNPLFRRIVGDEEFQEKVLADLDDLRMEMGEILARLEKLEEKVSDLSNKIDSFSTPVTVVPSPKDPSDAFTGRREELRELNEAVSEKGIVFVNGFGGIGKTELCMKFSSEYSKRTGCKVVWTTYKRSIKETIVTDVELNDKSGESTDADERFQWRKKMISSEGNILLIIDNFEWGADLSDIEDIGCKVLLTTREENIPAEYRTVTLGELSPDESFELLKTMATEENSRWIIANELEIKKKLKEVGYHTLTVTLMGGLIAEDEPDRDETVDEVFDFTGCEVYARDRGYRSVMGHIKAIFKLSSLDEESVDILRMAAMLPAGGMERSLFMECSGADKKALKKLTRSGWLKRTGSEDISMISVHPMISELMWSEKDDKPSISDDDPCHGFIDKVLGHIDSINKTGTAFDLVPLIDIIGKLSAILKNPDKNSNPSFVSKSLEIISESYNVVGMYADSMDNKGCSCLLQWDFKDALEFFMKALDIREKTLPEGHPSIATSLDNIGNANLKLKDNEKALECYMRALKIRENTLPEGHPDIGESLRNIGDAYWNFKEYMKALECYMRALEIYEAALPEGHPDIEETLIKIGFTYSFIRDYERILPEWRSNIVRSLEDVWVFDKGTLDFEEALEYILMVLEIREKMLPEGHPDFVDTLCKVGSTYDWLDDHENALKYYLRALDIYERLLPDAHEDIAYLLNDIGRIYGQMENNKEALKFNLRALDIYERLLPDAHEDIAYLLNDIGKNYLGLEEPEKALNYFFRALEIRKESLPEGHPYIADSLYNIGNAYSGLEDYEKAIKHYIEALEIYEIMQGKMSPTTIKLYERIGEMCCKTGQ